MRCQSLKELPAAPAGKRGWPWTVETPSIPEAMPDGRAWPRISIVVASLNQGAYIEEMIRSVLLQGYPDVELIVMDGGSTDGALEVIQRYARWISNWASEPDRGQSHAFNKGLVQITGSLFNIFDTDDYFLPGAFALVGAAHAEDPRAMIAGDVLRTWEDSPRSEVFRPVEVDLRTYVQWWKTYHHGQPGMFYPSELLSRVGPINEALNYLMDYDFTCRYLEVTTLRVIRCPVALIRHHPLCKSSGARSEYFTWECVQIANRYRARFPELEAEAKRHAAGVLFGAGVLRALRGQRDVWRFLRAGFASHPFWALYWIFPGWLLRKISAWR
jgi:glycosyltransferase involved in cell wall biosynthesis